ncbi:MAG: hypothetical protein JOZ18_16630 [Chloroflexi bacterium]|nr:hypothetical protein [Chloroflexota bacterium]
MKPLPDRLNDRLEKQNAFWRGERQAAPSYSSAPSVDIDPEVAELTVLAQRLKTAPHLQVDPGFAQRLEARILAHHALLPRRRATTVWGSWLFPRFHRTRLALGITLLCLLLVGTMGTLTAAAQVTNPNNPLYGVKSWVQSVQYSLTTSAAGRAELNWRTAHDQLKTLTDLADPTHAAAYRQALADLDQQITAFAQSIHTLPAGQDKDSLSKKLVTLKADARHVLRGLLPRLALSEKLLTTDELGRLDDAVPHISSAEVIVSLHPKMEATISIAGKNLQSGASLLVNNQLVASNGSLQNGTDVFMVSWPGTQPPKTLGILNPDGTVAQTTTITFTIANAKSPNQTMPVRSI